VFYRGELSNLTGYPGLVNHYFPPPTIFVPPAHSLPGCPKHPSKPCPEDRGKLLNQPDTVKRESSRGEIFVIVLNLMWLKNYLNDLETGVEIE
jgi:hypothetical protein